MDMNGKNKLEAHLSLLHLLHLSTVGFNSVIILLLALLPLLMPTAMLLKTVNLCLPVAVATALFFLVLHPESFVCIQTVTVWQNEN